jgi:hypothetical protein
MPNEDKEEEEESSFSLVCHFHSFASEAPSSLLTAGVPYLLCFEVKLICHAIVSQSVRLLAWQDTMQLGRQAETRKDLSQRQ